MKKKGLWLVLTMVLFVACPAEKGRTESSGGESKKQKIGVVVSTLNNPFFVDLVSGMRAQASSLPYELVVLDSQNDPSKELANVEDLITQGVSAILINPTDSDAVVRAVMLAQDASIPVISLDRSVNGVSVTAHIASDNISGGRMAGEFLLQELGERLAVVELEGITGASAARERGQGFNDVVKKYVVVRQVANFDRTQGLHVMENIIQSGTRFNAVFAHNDEMALGAMKALQDAGLTEVLVVGFDATDDARSAVSSGLMRATIAQKPQDIGMQGMQVAHQLLSAQKVDSYYPISLVLVE